MFRATNNLREQLKVDLTQELAKSFYTEAVLESEMADTCFNRWIASADEEEKEISYSNYKFHMHRSQVYEDILRSGSDEYYEKFTKYLIERT